MKGVFCDMSKVKLCQTTACDSLNRTCIPYLDRRSPGLNATDFPPLNPSRGGVRHYELNGPAPPSERRNPLDHRFESPKGNSFQPEKEAGIASSIVERINMYDKLGNFNNSAKKRTDQKASPQPPVYNATKYGEVDFMPETVNLATRPASIQNAWKNNNNNSNQLKYSGSVPSHGDLLSSDAFTKEGQPMDNELRLQVTENFYT